MPCEIVIRYFPNPADPMYRFRPGYGNPDQVRLITPEIGCPVLPDVMTVTSSVSSECSVSRSVQTHVPVIGREKIKNTVTEIRIAMMQAAVTRRRSIPRCLQRESKKPVHEFCRVPASRRVQTDAGTCREPRWLPKDDIYLVRRRYSLRKMVKNLQVVLGEPLR